MPDLTDRDEKEKAYAKLMAKLLQAYGGHLFEKLGDPPSLENLPDDFWDEEGRIMRDALLPFGEKEFMDAARQMAKEAPIRIDWDVINENAVNWARVHTGEWLIPKINDTTRETVEAEITRLREAIPEFFERQMTRGDLEQRLMENGLFGPVRAEMIAITEVTRAAARGEDAIIAELAAAGIDMVTTWSTLNDELVCEICGPLNEKEAAGRRDGEPYWIHPDGLGEIELPAHPRCRCNQNNTLPRN